MVGCGSFHLTVLSFLTLEVDFVSFFELLFLNLFAHPNFSDFYSQHIIIYFILHLLCPFLRSLFFLLILKSFTLFSVNGKIISFFVTRALESHRIVRDPGRLPRLPQSKRESLFNGHNFKDWKSVIRSVQKRADLWSIFQGPSKRPRPLLYVSQA